MAITETIVRGKQQRKQDEIKVYGKWKVYCYKNKRCNVFLYQNYIYFLCTYKFDNVTLICYMKFCLYFPFHYWFINFDLFWKLQKYNESKI